MCKILDGHTVAFAYQDGSDNLRYHIQGIDNSSVYFDIDDFKSNIKSTVDKILFLTEGDIKKIKGLIIDEHTRALTSEELEYIR